MGVLLFFYTTTVQAHQATLTWDANTESTVIGYRLHYGQTSGNYTSSIDVGLQTTYTVSNLEDGTYYFAVTAYDVDGMESAVFEEVSKNFSINADPNGLLPSPWLDIDIGNVRLAGSASYTSGAFTLSGSGADIGDTTDAFHFVYQPLIGDGTMIARVTDMTNTDSWAAVGVMIRENLDANARQAMVAVTPRHGVAFQRRLRTGGGSYHTAGTSVGTPYWVKLVRTGNNFTAYQSADGSKWVPISSATIDMAIGVYIGLAVTSHNNNTLNTVKLDNVSVYSN
jgi:hypothetical protein